MNSPTQIPVIIYDGNCRLCNSAVKFLKTKKHSEGFRFISSSEPESSGTLQQHGIEPSVADKTVILIQGDNIYTKSEAIIRALQRKGNIWKLAGMLLAVPKFIRDFFYDWIAGRRQKTT